MRTAGERRGAVPPVSHRYNGRELGQQIRQRPPQVGIVLLQTLQLVRVQAAVAVGMDGRLIKIVCTAPLEQHKLLDGFKVNVEHIAAQRHFSDICAHVADYKNDPIVQSLLTQNVNKPFSIPASKLTAINNLLSHDGKTIIPYFSTTQRRDITKIRFDEKCIAAFQIGILTDIPEQSNPTADILSDIKPLQGMPTFCAELIRIYEVRNAIHLHAELKKEISYHLALSKIAYRRMQPFLQQIKAKLSADGLI